MGVRTSLRVGWLAWVVGCSSFRTGIVDVDAAADLPVALDRPEVAVDVVSGDVVPKADGADVPIDAAIDAGDAPNRDAADVAALDQSDTADSPAPDATDAPVVDASDPDAVAPEDRPDVPPPCAAGESRCNGACVDMRRDSMNCGVCGNACSGISACSAGSCLAPRVSALHAAMIDRGVNSVITLEGVFGPTATVTFPTLTGTTTQNAVTSGPGLGAGRISVEVPGVVEQGRIQVHTLGTMVDGPLFRRASFLFGLQPFRTEYEQTGYGRQMPRLTTARANAVWLSTGRWLYVLGGVDTRGNALNTIERALVNADGTLGAFTAVPQPLRSLRTQAAIVRVGNQVFVMGGANGGESVASIERATVQMDGSLSAFEDAGMLPEPRAGHVAEVVGGYVHVLGGDRTAIASAPILGTGLLGPFENTLGVSTQRRSRPASVVAGSTLHLIGGFDGANALATIESCAIRGDGVVTGCQPGGRVSVARGGATAIALGDRVYLVGGRSETAALPSVEVAMLSRAGQLSGFALLDARSMQSARDGAIVTIVGNHVYAIGGAGTEAIGTVERAQFIANGSELQMGIRAADASERARHHLISVGSKVCHVGGSGRSTEEVNAVGCTEIVDNGLLATAWPGTGHSIGQTTPFIAGTSLHFVGGRYSSCRGMARLWSSDISAGFNTMRAEDHAIMSRDGSDVEITASVARVVRDRAYIFSIVGYSCTSWDPRRDIFGLSTSMLAQPRPALMGSLASQPNGEYLRTFLIDDTLYASNSSLSSPVESCSGMMAGAPSCVRLPITVPGFGPAFEVVGDRVVAIGGGGNACTYLTLPVSSGSAFVGAAPCLTTGRVLHASITIGNFVYVHGGRMTESSPDVGAVERLRIF